jgi:hypothetical protein
MGLNWMNYFGLNNNSGCPTGSLEVSTQLVEPSDAQVEGSVEENMFCAMPLMLQKAQNRSVYGVLEGVALDSPCPTLDGRTQAVSMSIGFPGMPDTRMQTVQFVRVGTLYVAVRTIIQLICCGLTVALFLAYKKSLREDEAVGHVGIPETVRISETILQLCTNFVMTDVLQRMPLVFADVAKSPGSNPLPHGTITFCI